MPRQVLGRGLGALLKNQNPSDEETPESSKAETKPTKKAKKSESSTKDESRPGEKSVVQVSVESIVPSPLQPRKEFSEESLSELADSIKERGILQPLIVRLSSKDDEYELIAGERRLRASKLAGLKKVPVILRTSEDQSALEWMLVENLQREDLNPLDEALGYKELSQKFKLKQDEIAKKVGKSRAAVANAMRLLKLPDEVQELLKKGDLSVGHAKVLLGIENEKVVGELVSRITDEQLSVRQLEDFIANKDSKPAKPTKPAVRESLPPEIEDLQDKLREKFATKVQIKYKEEKGSVEIKFFSDEDLDRIAQILQIKED